MVEEFRGEIRESGASVRHDRDWDARLDGLLSDHGDRAMRDRIGRERASVAVKPWDRDEERGLLRAARVVRDLAHVGRGGPVGNWDLRRLEEGAELQERIRPASRSADV